MYFCMCSLICSRSASIASLDTSFEKSRSISTDRRGRSKIVRLIAVPPFRARLSASNPSLSIKERTSARRQTFSKVSRTKPSSLACLPSVIRSKRIIISYPLIYDRFQIFWSKQFPSVMKDKIALLFKEIGFTGRRPFFTFHKKRFR